MRSSSSVISTICLKTRLRNRCFLSGNMDSIVDNLVSLINAKKARSAQGGQKDKTGAERENSGADKAYRADRREKTDNTDNRSKADSSAMNTETENGAKAETEAASTSKFSAGTETETET